MIRPNVMTQSESFPTVFETISSLGPGNIWGSFKKLAAYLSNSFLQKQLQIICSTAQRTFKAFVNSKYCRE